MPVIDMEVSHMGAKIAGFLATLMLSVPLAAIGLMAVFGIPQLVPANGSPSSTKDHVIRGVQNAMGWGDSNAEKADNSFTEFDSAPQFGETTPDRGPPSSEYGNSRNQYASSAPARNAFDSEQSFPSASRDRNAVRNDTPLDRVNNAQSPRHWSDTPAMGNHGATNSAMLQQPVGFDSATSNVRSTESDARQFDRNGAFDSSSAGSHATSLTWRQASLRLSEMGITKYHLERGAAEGSFLFVCMFSPGDAPHIVHRFESEADDPLVAVNQVLQQIDRWMQNRYAATNFPSKPQSMSVTSGAAQR